MPPFKVNAAYKPVADQPKALAGLAEGIEGQDRFQTLLGVTGSGKTATMAFTIEQVQRPALVIAHNKTLAAQLCNEFREFFPDNSVEYFVSYYDYYQPEAYVPAQDLYIEKDSSINEEIDRLRHSATSALFGRRDVIVVASVSCIYGLGSPQKYNAQITMLKKGEMVDRDEILRKLVDNMYTRNDAALGRGSFRVRGETLEVFPAYAESAYRAIFFGDEIEQIQHFDPLTGEVFQELEHAGIWPATHYATDRPTIERAIGEIRDELEARTKELEQQGKLLESHRLRQRTQFDMEMLRELGFCNGIENYSRILDGRAPGERPYCLLDFFPRDFVCFIDESHQTVPQIGGMYEGDRSRKQTLVEYGFRLPSALDNRPQTFDEFLQRTPQIIFVSATPGDFERNHSSRVVEQIVRPTGVVDPGVEVRETKNQIDDLMEEIRKRVEVEERTLVTTLTKKMAEDLTDYLLEYGFRVRYLHSEIDTLERIQIIRELRLGEFDILVGVNLLREGLDLPEVSLVAILDADKEGFLRGETSLIQTIGRAARNIRGTVIMYADKETAAMRRAIGETDRRRAIQVAYNEEHGITPATIQKGISDITDFLMMESKVPTGRGRRRQADTEGMSAEQIRKTIVELEEEMLAAADDLRFEFAAKLRDEIKALRRELDEAEASA
ncbi:MAG TPA: excinuclease ABC subunit UvrB [Thermoleophilaceae bacterium]|nr:excinuclease ABC subunit UvrB [Thermoleophilaceae bacterium]